MVLADDGIGEGISGDSILGAAKKYRATSPTSLLLLVHSSVILFLTVFMPPARHVIKDRFANLKWANLEHCYPLNILFTCCWMKWEISEYMNIVPILI